MLFEIYAGAIFKLIDYLLNIILYYKIKGQESYYYKFIINYLFPKKNIMHAKLCNNRKSIDITNEFTTLVKNNKENIIWNNLVDSINNDKDLKYINNLDNFHLDIRYTIEDVHYRIIYHYKNDDIIQFPPYTSEEIKKYKEDEGYKKTVLFAEISNKNIDVTQLIQEYAGPMNDFYKNKNNNTIKIYASLIKDNEGNHLLIDNDSLLVTDSHAIDNQFNGNDLLEI